MTRKLPELLIPIVFLILNILFHYPIIAEIIHSDSSFLSINDGIVTEFLTETEYQNLIKWQNPFSSTNKLFYPFKTNFALNDTSFVNMLFIIFLHPLTSIHRATLMIVFTNFFLASIFMYFLLRRLKIDPVSAVLTSLIYTFSPYLSYRVLGHYTYTAHYFFPLMFLSFIWCIGQKTLWKKSVSALIVGILMAFFFFANPYYFIMLILALLFYGVWYFIFLKSLLFRLIKTNVFGIVFIVIAFLLVLLPWLLRVKQWWQFERAFDTPSLYRPIILSADVLNFVTPSEYNPLYAFVVESLDTLSGPFSKFAYFFFYNWERFAYPGIVIILVYIFILLYNRRLPKKLWHTIKLPFFTSLFFFLLTLGPFLKVFNRWFITVDEGIKIYLPLPFLLMFYVPIFNIISVPTRFITAFVFFACLTTAFTFNHFLPKIQKRLPLPFFLSGLFLIFFIDQYYLIPKNPQVKLPIKSYQYIKKDPRESVVLEIPFVIRDGLRYRGYVHALSSMRGVLIHQKPIIGGYLSRVSPAVFKYYDNLPFITYLSSIIDKGNFVLYKQEPHEPNVKPFTGSIDLAKVEFDFLDIKYVLLKEGEKYTMTVSDLLKKVGFSQKMKEGDYILWERYLSKSKQNFDQVNFGSMNDFLYAGENLGSRETDFRWAQGRSAKIFFKTNNLAKTKLHLKMASFHESQLVTIYLNRKYVAKKNIPTMKQELIIDISNRLKTGINEIFFEFSKNFKPSAVLPKNNDGRHLAVQFFSLQID